jgi:hypothetical protein
MKKETPVLLGQPHTEKYFKLKKVSRNKYVVETVEIENNRLINVFTSNEHMLVAAFDLLRKKTAEEYFKALQDD